MRARIWAAPVDNSAGQLDAAAAGAELELEPSDELDFSDFEEPVDSELVAEPLADLLAELLADSRLSVR